MKHVTSISWHTGKHVMPYIHLIILCGHVQTFLLCGFPQMCHLMSAASDLRTDGRKFAGNRHLFLSFLTATVTIRGKHGKQVWLIW